MYFEFFCLLLLESLKNLWPEASITEAVNILIFRLEKFPQFPTHVNTNVNGSEIIFIWNKGVGSYCPKVLYHFQITCHSRDMEWCIAVGHVFTIDIYLFTNQPFDCLDISAINCIVNRQTSSFAISLINHAFFFVE
jgi:hypothetical protein